MRKKTRVCWFMILLSCITSRAQEDIEFEILKNEFIYSEADFASSHASTVAELKDGKLISAWFGGTHERHQDVSIYTSFKKKGKWSPPKKVADGVINDSLRYPTWNPVLFNTEKTLFLFYKIGPSPSTWWGAYKTSEDNGKTWSHAVLLPSGILGPIKNKPIQLESGRIISPSSVELDDGEVWRAHMEISDDSGKTWRKILVNHDSEYKVIQPSIVQLKGGILKAFFRSDQDFILESVSKDDGENWSAFTPSKLPNPNSGIDAVSLDNGMFLMVYNPLASGRDWFNGRNKLNLAVSKDAENWQDILQLENEAEGEFSYPAIIQGEDGQIHITYTYNREKINYVSLKFLN
ncbi:exo-alpha-sialidase [Antarcticibacterium sp. 1MA-6-2]|uniref:sialidase family protein n=1 Tax=Antarcticibacterium sp. 1MA-6-2 TaxID=2908210 RepID=UPI001F18BFC2|nr:sialidase family protein [Antarcticibacterium sp. 1MA-6-2]UJH90735.1 exo-alpha-sialidase [Antarcticibacterium sp. 1MA-6-2]